MYTKTINITIDNKKVETQKDRILLWVALENNVYIPNLCAIHGAISSQDSCRLCFVEIEGKDNPVTACTEAVYEGMVIQTRSERVDLLVKAGFELIMSNHQTNCKDCSAKANCGLQKIAKSRNLSLKTNILPKIISNLPIDSSRVDIIYNPNKCILCGKCIIACRHEGNSILGFANRGFERIVTTSGNKPLSETNCDGCGSCIKTCPVGAFSKS